MFLHRYAPGKINIAILLITVVSFILSAIAVEVKPSATFYILPTRAWELGLGAILAVYPGLSKLGYKASLVLNVLGAVLITIALFFIDEQTTFPGPAALLPCLGAMFLIASGGTYSNLPTSYILETKPAVFIGKISYSLYLWHWPVIVFTKYLSSNTSLTLGLALLSIVLSLILSVFSWKYIETPFRSKGISRQFIFRLSGVSMAILLAIALSVLNFNFLKIPLSDLQTQIVNVARDRVADREENCEAIDDFGNVCAIGQIRKPSHYDFLLFGDSHAEAISEAFSLAAAQAGVSGLATNVNCPPLLGVNRKIAPECTHFVASVIKGLENRDDIKTVILHGRWAQLDTGKFMPGEAKNHNDALSVVEDAYHEITGSTHEVFKVGIARTVEAILATGRKVIIIESVPEVGWNVPYATLMENRWHIPKPAPPTITSFTERQAGVFDAFKPLRDMPNVRFYAPADYLCTPDCIVELEGLPAYFDDDHLSNHAAQILLKDLINDALANL